MAKNTISSRRGRQLHSPVKIIGKLGHGELTFLRKRDIGKSDKQGKGRGFELHLNVPLMDVFTNNVGR